MKKKIGIVAICLGALVLVRLVDVYMWYSLVKREIQFQSMENNEIDTKSVKFIGMSKYEDALNTMASGKDNQIVCYYNLINPAVILIRNWKGKPFSMIGYALVPRGVDCQNLDVLLYKTESYELCGSRGCKKYWLPCYDHKFGILSYQMHLTRYVIGYNTYYFFGILVLIYGLAVVFGVKMFYSMIGYLEFLLIFSPYHVFIRPIRIVLEKMGLYGIVHDSGIVVILIVLIAVPFLSAILSKREVGFRDRVIIGSMMVLPIALRF